MFDERDFDAYAPQKWRSNAFTRERLGVKQKLLDAARLLASRMVAADGSPLLLEASAENPALWNHHLVDAQHVYFSRALEARKEIDVLIDRGRSIAALVDDPTPQRSHLFLAITVAHAGLTIALKLHPDARIDRQNLERKCEDFFEREKLRTLLGALGDEVQVGRMPTDPVSKDATLQPVAGLSDESLVGVLAGTASGPGWLFVGQTLPREDARLAADLLALLGLRLSGLLDVYNFVAWHRENDYVSIKDQLQKEKQAKRQKHLQRNDRVRIVRGVLAGKTGVVQEIDAKGGAKVLVGKMVVKVAAEDLLRA